MLRLFSTDSPFPADLHPAIPLVLLVLLDFLICRAKLPPEVPLTAPGSPLFRPRKSPLLPPEVPFGRELFEEICGLLHRPVWTSYAPGSPLPEMG